MDSLQKVLEERGVKELGVVLIQEPRVVEQHVRQQRQKIL